MISPRAATKRLRADLRSAPRSRTGSSAHAGCAARARATAASTSARGWRGTVPINVPRAGSRTSIADASDGSAVRPFSATCGVASVTGLRYAASGLRRSPR